jgi:hypothetical protein
MCQIISLNQIELLVNLEGATHSQVSSTMVNYRWARVRGHKTYELSNHSGNILNTITDISVRIDVNSDGEVDYFEADVMSVSDYYPFGMQIKEREISSYRQ